MYRITRPVLANYFNLGSRKKANMNPGPCIPQLPSPPTSTPPNPAHAMKDTGLLHNCSFKCNLNCFQFYEQAKGQ